MAANAANVNFSKSAAGAGPGLMRRRVIIYQKSRCVCISQEAVEKHWFAALRVSVAQTYENIRLTT